MNKNVFMVILLSISLNLVAAMNKVQKEKYKQLQNQYNTLKKQLQAVALPSICPPELASLHTNQLCAGNMKFLCAEWYKEFMNTCGSGCFNSNGQNITCPSTIDCSCTKTNNNTNSCQYIDQNGSLKTIPVCDSEAVKAKRKMMAIIQAEMAAIKAASK